MLAFYLALIDDPSDAEMFLKILTQYESSMLKYAYSLLNDYHMSEDVIQDVWFKVARNIKALRNKGETETRNYLYISVKRRVIDVIEKEKIINIATSDFLDNMRDARSSKEIDDLATQDLIIRVLKQIPDKYSDVLYLYLVVGFKEREIADSLDININTLRQQIHRGRKMFAEIYEREIKA